MDRASAFGIVIPLERSIAEGSGFESQVGRLFYFRFIPCRFVRQQNRTVQCSSAVCSVRGTRTLHYSRCIRNLVPSHSSISCSLERHTFIGLIAMAEISRHCRWSGSPTVQHRLTAPSVAHCTQGVKDRCLCCMRMWRAVGDNSERSQDITSDNITVWCFFVSYFPLRARNIQSVLCYQQN